MSTSPTELAPGALAGVRGSGDGTNLIAGGRWYGHERLGCAADTAAFAGAGLVAGAALASPGLGAALGAGVGFTQSANCAHEMGWEAGYDPFHLD